MSTARRSLIAWAQAAPLAAVFVVFFLIPLALILTVSFWKATDYELIPAFTPQAYLDIFNGCFDGGACVSGRTYVSTLKFSLLVWLFTGGIGFAVAYFLAFHVKSQMWQTVLFIVCTRPLRPSSGIHEIMRMTLLVQKGTVQTMNSTVCHIWLLT